MPDDVFSRMADAWPSSVVARRKVEVMTGGAIKSKHLANLDSKQEGPPERVIIGGHICYPVVPFVEWLRERSNRKCSKGKRRESL